jgi:diguanylate cyclase (GGDEF)-like protein/PAS domain S-box-containing protein
MTIQSSDTAFAEGDFVRYALDCAAIVAMTDVQGTITFVNNKFCEISGYSREELIGENHRMLRSEVHDAAYFRDMYRTVANKHVWHGEICNRRKDGTHYWVDTTIVPHVGSAGKVDSYTAIRFDITARRDAEKQLLASANLDVLTGLPNRRSFIEHVDRSIQAAQTTAGTVVVAIIDLDTFKEINDSLGHVAGDCLLRAVSQRLNSFVSSSVYVARLGGDEFGLIISDVDPTIALSLVEQVQHSLRQPIDIGSVVRSSTASIGVASYPKDAETSEDIIRNADLALDRAKSLGRDRLKLFSQPLRSVSDRRSELVLAIEQGVLQGQFLLHYQPVVPFSERAPLSVEALIRWNHPEQGLLTPGNFLSELNDPGLFSTLGMLVAETAVRDLQLMREKGLPIKRIAINVSNADFRSDEFSNLFLTLIEERRLAPSDFCIEVTEGVFLGRDFVDVERRICRLHDVGVEIALDDFGTGFANMAHLRRMPIHRLKIDRTFIANLLDSQADRAIVRGIIDIAHGMGKLVTAEGVETADQRDLLLEMGCDSLQGWYFAKSHAVDELEAVLAGLPCKKRAAAV